MKSYSGRIQLAVLWVALGGAVLGQTLHDRVASITAALRNGEFDHALDLLKPALEAAPDNPQLQMLQGLAYSGKGNRDEALISYRAALKIAPNYLPALEGAAQLEYEAGRADADPLLEHVLKLEPGNETSHAMLGVLAYKAGDCAAAVEHFSASESMLASQPGALQEYGFCLVNMKQSEKAIPVFDRLLAENPNDLRARRSLAAVQLDSGRAQDALATLDPLLNADPDTTTLQLAANAYEANKDTRNAVKVLREAIVKNPRDTSLYVDFADIAMTHQSFDAGIEMINAGLKLQPSAAELYLARGVLYVQLADYDKAQADFEKSEALDPRVGESAAAQGMVAEERNQSDPAQALATVRAKLAKKPGDAFLWYLQGAIISQTAPEPGSAEFVQGMKSAQKAVELNPSLTAAHNVLSKYDLDAGNFAAAAKECRIVLDHDPADQSALYHLVIALRKTNKTGEIPELLKRLAKARQDAAKQEAEHNRYKLVVSPSAEQK